MRISDIFIPRKRAGLLVARNFKTFSGILFIIASAALRQRGLFRLQSMTTSLAQFKCIQ